MDKLVEKCLLTDEEIANNLDCEVERTYQTDGGCVTTVSVDQLLRTQLIKAFPILKKEWGIE